MKIFVGLLALVIAFAACSSPKKTTVKGPVPTVTKNDRLLGGTSYSNAIVIMVKKESDGINEEYRWLKNSYPGYGLIKRTHVSKSPKQYDIVRIRTRTKEVKDIYFDSTNFWGKN